MGEILPIINFNPGHKDSKRGYLLYKENPSSSFEIKISELNKKYFQGDYINNGLYALKSIFDNEGTPHYTTVLKKAGSYLLLAGIRSSSSNNERTVSQYKINYYSDDKSYWMSLTDGYNIF